MANYKTFNKDLQKGKEAEGLVSEFFDGEIVEGRFKDYDLFVEVKWDLMYARTGNVAIEITHKGAPSGVFGSKAHVIVYRLSDEFYYCDVEECKQFVENYMNDNPSCIRRGGDNGDSSMALLPVAEFKKLFTILFTANKNED